jgi:NodT family efflux transporter outer membrane factor (OMF) lipoprotein
MRAASRTMALPGLAMTVLLGACTVGPDWHGTPQTLPAGAAYRRAAGVATAQAPTLAHWWTALHDTELDRLEASALVASPDLATAAARIRSSRAQLRLTRSDQLPTTGTTALDLHVHGGGLGALEGSASSSDTDLYNAGFDATWELDIFGGGRRAVEGARAALGAQQASLADAQVSLTAEVAQSYVTLRDVEHRTALATSSAALQSRMLGLLQQRLAGGTASELDVARLQTEVESTQADLLPLRAAALEQEDRLAVLTGRMPGDLDAELGTQGPVPMPPSSVQVGDPAALLRQRPDIRMAEARMIQANALIGQKVADYFPKVTLFGNLGFGSTDVGQLFTGGAFTAIGAPVLQWKPFDFGRTQASVDQARAGLQETEAAYRSTVLNALGEVETALSRYGIQRSTTVALGRVKASADKAASLTRLRYEGGTASVIDTLDTERQRLTAEQSLAQAEATLTQDYISLQKSLGMGWQQ